MIFLDSSFIVAFEVDGDTNHIDAVRSMREVVLGKHGPPAISDYIFDEVVTVTFARTRSPARARQVGEAMLESFRMLKVDEGIFKDAWRQFRAQKHTKFSFTDSTTAELMHRYDIGSIATFDKGFLETEFAVVGPQKHQYMEPRIIQ